MMKILFLVLLCWFLPDNIGSFFFLLIRRGIPAGVENSSTKFPVRKTLIRRQNFCSLKEDSWGTLGAADNDVDDDKSFSK